MENIGTTTLAECKLMMNIPVQGLYEEPRIYDSFFLKYLLNPTEMPFGCHNIIKQALDWDLDIQNVDFVLETPIFKGEHKVCVCVCLSVLLLLGVYFKNHFLF